LLSIRVFLSNELSSTPQTFPTGKRAIAMNNITPNDSGRSKSEQFELLSAYLDGEVSVAERQQVEGWLSQDPKLRQTYQQMLTLQSSFKSLPVATQSVQTDQLVRNVLARADRLRRMRVLGGAGAVAALIVGSVSSVLIGQNWTVKTAQQPSVQPTFAVPTAPAMPAIHNDPSTLMIALERPPVEIPIVHNGTNRKQGVDPKSMVNF
jgi:hypothetical protein